MFKKKKKRTGWKDYKLNFPNYMQTCTFHLVILFYIIIKQKVIPEKSEIKLKQINLTMYQVGGMVTWKGIIPSDFKT